MVDAGEPQILERERPQARVQLVVGSVGIQFTPMHAVEEGSKLGFCHARSRAGRVDGGGLDSIIIRLRLMSRTVSV